MHAVRWLVLPFDLRTCMFSGCAYMFIQAYLWYTIRLHSCRVIRIINNAERQACCLASVHQNNLLLLIIIVALRRVKRAEKNAQHPMLGCNQKQFENARITFVHLSIHPSIYPCVHIHIHTFKVVSTPMLQSWNAIVIKIVTWCDVMSCNFRYFIHWLSPTLSLKVVIRNETSSLKIVIFRLDSNSI